MIQNDMPRLEEVEVPAVDPVVVVTLIVVACPVEKPEVPVVTELLWALKSP